MYLQERALQQEKEERERQMRIEAQKREEDRIRKAEEHKLETQKVRKNTASRAISSRSYGSL